MRILFIREESEDQGSCADHLRTGFAGTELVHVNNMRELERVLGAGPFDAAVIGEGLGVTDGVGLIRLLRAVDPLLPIIMVPENADLERAVEGLRTGLADYVPEDSPRAANLASIVRSRAEEGHRRRREETERRRAERIVERVPIGLYETDSRGRIVKVNPALAQMLGYRNEAEALGRQAVDHYADARARERFVELLARDGVVTGFEFELLRTDGSTLWVENNGRAVLDEDGRIVRFEGSLQDVDRRRRTEEELSAAMRALERSELRFRSLVENALDAVYRYRYLPWRGYEYLSPSIAEISGYSPEEHYADPDFALGIVHPEDLHLLEEMRRDPEAAATGVWTIRWIKPDGQVVWTEERNTPVYEDGRLVAVEGVVRDVTEQRRAEETNRSLLQALDQAAEGVVVTDAENRIIYANEAVRVMTGYSLEDIRGMGPEVFAAAPGFGGRMPEITGEVRAGRVWRGELEGRRRDGASMLVQASVAPVRSAVDETIGFAVTLRDIGHERELEERLWHSQKLEAIGQLAGGVAHDFNNLLTSILGYTDILLGGFSETDERREDLLEIRRSAERAAALTRQLLAFSRRQIMQMQPVDLNAVLRGMERVVRQLAGPGIQTELNLSEDRLELEADTGQLEQVVINLVSNAREAMQGEGRLMVSTGVMGWREVGPADVVSARAEEYVYVRIQDTGRGMTEEVQQHLFEPFFSTKEKSTGGGLGLPMVYGIVKQSGGEILVESLPGWGSLFTVAFPRLPESNSGKHRS